ncbi:MAG: hypothetical protein AAF717_02405 [Bacteroidota bacterium]
MKKIGLLLMVIVMYQSVAQNHSVRIAEEKQGNRLLFYGLNEDDTDYDVLFEVKGTNFRQSKARPRWIRMPATSKVLLKTIILLRDKTPQYTYTLKVNDSLSPRVLRPEFTIIEVPPKMITPKKQITLYNPGNCTSCDSIALQLKTNHFLFTEILLPEKPKVKASLAKMLNQPLDSLQHPIINLGGHLYTWIRDYETLMQEVEK